MTPHQTKSEEVAAKAISKAKTRLVLAKDANCAFFAALVMRLKFAPAWDMPTAATDGRSVFYNPEFVNKLSDKELTGVLAHEVMHCANKFFARLGRRNTLKFNVAHDLAINPIIIAAGMTLPKGCLLPGHPPFKHLPGNMSAEEYYNLIPDETIKDLADSCGIAIMPKIPDYEQKQLDVEWTLNLAQARNASKRFGTLHGTIERICGEALEPAADWKAELREFVTRRGHADYSWKRPSKRFLHAGLHLPSKHSTEIGHVVVAIDTSGSITDETLRRFASEVCDIATCGVQKITTMYHTVCVYKTTEWTPEDGPYALENGMDGGTSHLEVFSKCDEMEEAPAVLISLTDMASQFPQDEPAYPVLFASINKRATPPFGTMIVIPPE